MAELTLRERALVERSCKALSRACWAGAGAPPLFWPLTPKELMVRTRVLVCFADVRGDRGACDVLHKLCAADPTLAVRLHDVLASGVPGVELLDDFDSCLFFHNALDLWPRDAMGDQLASFVDGGRGVVTALFATVDNMAEHAPDWHYVLSETAGNLALGGRWRREAYSPLSPGRQDERVGLARAVTLGRAVAGHPVLRGVRTLSAGREAYLGTGALCMSPRARPIAYWHVRTALPSFEEEEPDGQLDEIFQLPSVQGHATQATELVLAAEAETCAEGKRMVVALNLYPPSSDAHSALWDASTDGARLMANALRYVSPRTQPDRRPCSRSEERLVEMAGAHGGTSSVESGGRDGRVGWPPPPRKLRRQGAHLKLL